MKLLKKLIPLLVVVTFALLMGLSGCGPAAWVHYIQGISHGNSANYDLAIAQYTKAIELNPEYTEAYYHRGQAYNAIAEKPTQYPSFNVANCLDQAISDLSRAIELKPGYCEATYYRGLAYSKRGEYDAAIADYSRIIESDYKGYPPINLRYETRGKAYLKTGQYDNAISDFSKIIELLPKASAAYASRGIAYMRKGEYDLAIIDLTEGIESRFDPSDRFKYLWYQDADWYLYRGHTYQAMGLKNEALADFQKVLELAKNPEWIQAAQQGIEEIRTQT
jgi:tetratricopeptide (TPR) repeat protein